MPSVKLAEENCGVHASFQAKKVLTLEMKFGIIYKSNNQQPTSNI